jgi:DNA-binding response OmpR family regulator
MMPKKKILLVQDILTHGSNTRMALEGLNYDVFVAGSGLSALVTARKAAADLILLDVALPDMEWRPLAGSGNMTTPLIPIILLVRRGHTQCPSPGLRKGLMVICKSLHFP